MDKPKFWLPFSKLFVPTGRISRLQYFVYGLIYLAIYFAAFFVLASNKFFQVNPDGGLADTSPAAVACYGAVELGFLWLVFVNDVKRLHDLNWPGIVAILVLIDAPVDLGLEIARIFTTLPPVAGTVQAVVDGIGKVSAIGVGLFLTFGPGNKGKNKYGPDPLRPPPPIDVF